MTPTIVTGDGHRFLAAEKLREIGAEPGYVPREPVGRNTSTARTSAARTALESGTDTVLGVTPAYQTVVSAK